jgi:hypothetical protein
MQLPKVRSAVLAAAVSAAALVLSGAPAIASTQSSHSTTGPEVIYGETAGRAATVTAPPIPLRLRGVVKTHDSGFVLGNGHTRQHELVTPRGNLAVRLTGKHTTTERTDARTCRGVFVEDQTLRVLGGQSTGVFAGASGPGAVQIYFTAFSPRYKSGPKKGQCNFRSNKVRARGALVRFIATAVLTVRK